MGIDNHFELYRILNYPV